MLPVRALCVHWFEQSHAVASVGSNDSGCTVGVFETEFDVEHAISVQHLVTSGHRDIGDFRDGHPKSTTPNVAKTAAAIDSIERPRITSACWASRYAVDADSRTNRESSGALTSRAISKQA